MQKESREQTRTRGKLDVGKDIRNYTVLGLRGLESCTDEDRVERVRPCRVRMQKGSEEITRTREELEVGKDVRNYI